MAPSEIVTETIILHLREGSDLENVEAGDDHTFIQLTNIVKTQKGFICQYWGPQFENPNLFVWFIDWKSIEDHTTFTNSKAHKSFMAGLGQVFDLEKADPLMTYIRLDPVEVAAALKAGVTEVSYFILPNGGEESKKAIANALVPIGDAVKTVGQATGSAMAWVFKVKPEAAAPQPGEEMLCGIFGYASIDVHMKWREQPEHEKASEIFAELEKRNLILRPADVPGIDPETGYFHVHFHQGK